jgi:hypothetical protein
MVWAGMLVLLILSLESGNSFICFQFYGLKKAR